MAVMNLLSPTTSEVANESKGSVSIDLPESRGLVAMSGVDRFSGRESGQPQVACKVKYRDVFHQP
mgnify:CR=1 FL=1